MWALQLVYSGKQVVWTLHNTPPIRTEEIAAGHAAKDWLRSFSQYSQPRLVWVSGSDENKVVTIVASLEEEAVKTAGGKI